MSWKFDYRIVRGWGVSGLFDDKGNMILGAPGLQVPTGEYKRQIETAPEMLELIRLVYDLKGRHNDHPYNELTGLIEQLDNVTDLATALLAKIEGGRE